MKAKHIIALNFLLALLIPTIVLGWSKCVNNANRWYDFYTEQGTPAKIYSGWYRQSPHRWCEYWNGYEWVMARDTIHNVNDGWKRPDEYRIRRKIK